MNLPTTDRLPIRLGVLALYPHDTAPGQRFRFEQWLPHLRAEGIEVDILPFADQSLVALMGRPGRLAGKLFGMAKGYARRLRHCGTLYRYDAVLIYRAACIAGPALFERLIPFFPRPVLFDFDDAIWMRHTAAANKRFGWLKFPGKTAAICRLSDHVVVGNAYLADYARTHNSNVTVIPSSVDTDTFRPAPRRHLRGPVVIGWTGSSTSQTYLEAFAPVLRSVAAIPNVELRVHSDRRPDLPGMKAVWRPWSPDTEAEELAAFDIGLMPMPDDPWARGKCAMKALLYMAMGIPAVCSAVGTNLEVIRDGVTGLLPRSDADWVEGLRRLVEDPSLRHRLGVSARRTVEERFSANVCARSFAAVLRRVVEAGNVATDKRSDSAVPARV